MLAGLRDVWRVLALLQLGEDVVAVDSLEVADESEDGLDDEADLLLASCPLGAERAGCPLRCADALELLVRNLSLLASRLHGVYSCCCVGPPVAGDSRVSRITYLPVSAVTVSANLRHVSSASTSVRDALGVALVLSAEVSCTAFSTFIRVRKRRDGV